MNSETRLRLELRLSRLALAACLVLPCLSCTNAIAQDKAIERAANELRQIESQVKGQLDDLMGSHSSEELVKRFDLPKEFRNSKAFSKAVADIEQDSKVKHVDRTRAKFKIIKPCIDCMLKSLWGTDRYAISIKADASTNELIDYGIPQLLKRIDEIETRLRKDNGLQLVPFPQ